MSEEVFVSLRAREQAFLDLQIPCLPSLRGSRIQCLVYYSSSVFWHLCSLRMNFLIPYI